MKTIVIFGAGIAGLSAAHELVQLGYTVSVYEATNQPGGFFRSSRVEKDNMPSEYSWHGMGPWYHNTFDLMRKIPFSEKGNIYDLALSRPIDFGIFPDSDEAQFNEGLQSIPKMFRMDTWEFIKWSYLMLKTWTSNNRSQIQYAKINAAQAWKPYLKDKAYKTWRSCFGPWIGSDWLKVSLHTAGDFFRKLVISGPRHQHKADQGGPPWTQGGGDGWLLFKGPSSEYWFNPWVKFLKEKGVNFFWEKALTKLEFDGVNITSACCGEEKIQGDIYILAINPFFAANILSETPALEKQEELNLFKPLIQDGPHAQVSFRLAFSEEVKFPRKRTAVVVSDSEFNLTLFAEEQIWDKEVDLGKNIKSLWTGTSCISSVPGRIYHKPVNNCTKDEFIEEIKVQILSCNALNDVVKEANNGRGLQEFSIIKIEVWHEWEFSSEGIKSLQPKWVTTTNTQAYLPAQKTPVSNLFLAGAHTKTQAQVWSIEGAVESGRRAAKAIDKQVQVLDQYRPPWIKILSKIDDILYSIKAPQIIDSIFWFLLILGGYLFHARGRNRIK
ncbi:MAG: FAD-dependent oxidoreductase [Candidatus Riflebacteria bacterium]|nr:FAD-dependent oxidoreductase [Candidatus Riflebacteria bacterium]